MFRRLREANVILNELTQTVPYIILTQQFGHNPVSLRSDNHAATFVHFLRERGSARGKQAAEKKNVAHRFSPTSPEIAYGCLNQFQRKTTAGVKFFFAKYEIYDEKLTVFALPCQFPDVGRFKQFYITCKPSTCRRLRYRDATNPSGNCSCIAVIWHSSWKQYNMLRNYQSPFLTTRDISVHLQPSNGRPPCWTDCYAELHLEEV